MIGTTLDDKYRIDRLLGRGGMGSVYAAEDVRTGEKVAVKVIQAQLPGHAPDIAERFAREARAAGSVDTEHIVRCLDSGTDALTGQPYMVLEYMEGDDLHRVLRRLGPIDPDLALRIVAQACLGLSKAHEAKVVHRDIKPANIFLAKRGEGERIVKLLDFGIAKIRKDPNEEQTDSDALTRTGSMLGSPMYMSPEQARSVKNVDQRADLWSLGVVLYQALAGRTPFNHISGLGDLVLALWSEPPPPVQQFAPWVSPEIAAILDRMLRLEPSERFQSAAEVFEAVSALLPDGIELRESMLVSLGAEAQQRSAPTYFRRLDTRPRPERPRTDPTPSRVPTAAPRSQLRAVTARPETPSGASATSGAAVAASTGSSTPPGPSTHNGFATTDASQATPPPAARKVAIGPAAVLIALLGLGLGAGGVFVLLPGTGSAPAAGSSSAGPAITAAPHEPRGEPTVAPAGEPPAAVAASAAPRLSATASPTTAPAAPTTPATTVVATPPARAVEPPTRPRATAAPSVTASAPPTVSAPPSSTFSDFGDRK